VHAEHVARKALESPRTAPDPRTATAADAFGSMEGAQAPRPLVNCRSTGSPRHALSPAGPMDSTLA